MAPVCLTEILFLPLWGYFTELWIAIKIYHNTALIKRDIRIRCLFNLLLQLIDIL